MMATPKHRQQPSRSVVPIRPPDVYKPWDYQKYCIRRILTDPAVGLMLGMGLGKTVITLTAINDLKYNRFDLHRAIVIAPKKVAEATWTKEAAKWEHLQHLRIVPVIGSTKQRIKALNTPGDVWVMSRDNVVWLVEHYRNAWPFDMVVLDELSSFKNSKAERTKALMWIRHHVKRVVGLTGTPAPNGLLDLWAQVYLLDQGERLETKVGHYRTKYFERNYNGFGYTTKPGADEVIQRKIADICISMKAEDYLELPDCVTNVVPVVLDDKATKMYRQMEREAILQLGDAEITALSAAALTNKLLQMCNGSIYHEEQQLDQITGMPVIDAKGNIKTIRHTSQIHDAKVEALLETLEQIGDSPALVFYSYQLDLERITQALAKGKRADGSPLRFRTIETAQDIDDWNAREIDVALAHPASTAYGLNMQDGGNHVIWYGLTWSLELYQQANARLHRQGQLQKVILHHLVVVGGADEMVMAALEGKAVTQDKLLDALKARIEDIRAS